MTQREIKFRAWDRHKIKVRKGCKGFYQQQGYTMAKAPYHPHANKRGYVPLHRLIVENQLGRYLSPRKEIVHHIDGNRSNNNIQNLKLTTPSEHYIEEHFKARNPNGQFVAEEEIFGELKFRLFDRDKNIVQIYSLKELISKTYRRAKFEFRGRWTGLKDKNGKEIYEGDIVNVKYSYDYPTLEGYERNYSTVVGTVKFDHGSFDVVRPANGPFDIGEKEVWQGIIPQENLTDIETEWEIIGNIYENLELLEVQA